MIPRSGSTLLCTTLWQTGIAGRPEEFFSSVFRAEFLRYGQLGVRDYREYISAVIRASTTSNGVFGASMHAFQTKLFIELVSHSIHKECTSLKEAIETTFPNTKYIFLRRKDKIAQAISFYRAVMTGEWRRFNDSVVPESDKKLTFNQYGIKRCLELLERHDTYWENFFHTNTLSPLRLTYEDLVDSYESTIRSVLEYLELPSDIAIPEPFTKKISDERSLLWKEKFLQLEKSDPVIVRPIDYLLVPF